MILEQRIPKEFYSLFRTKNMDSYMQILVAIYDENSEVFTALGLTREECQLIIEDTVERARIVWVSGDELINENESGQIIQNDQDIESAEQKYSDSPGFILKRLIRWGWIKSDFDEKLNTYVISFPEYSQLYIELFKKLLSDDEGMERESMLSVYSALFTYHSDSEKNNDILKNALRTSKRLGQMLSNMQDGMRSYFDDLSGMKNFIGIQKVLVEEINNSDSRKYAILTTTDSFYRYKEAVKELTSRILNENEKKKDELEKKRSGLEPGSIEFRRNEFSIDYCEKARTLVYQIEREFNQIERKYNKLIEQKTIFAKRALARIHYILQEGAGDDDNILKLVSMLDDNSRSDRILEDLRSRMKFTSQFKNVTDDSFSARRDREINEFMPEHLENDDVKTEHDMAEFVPKPLYTKKELDSFKKANMSDGKFIADNTTVRSVEDLEKLMFVWQEETKESMENNVVSIDGDITGEDGFTYSKLIIGSRKTS